MKKDAPAETQRDILDRKLTELTLLAKKLCPEAKVEANTVRYEDEDGRVKVFPPPGLSEVEEEALEETLIEKCIEIFDETGLFIVCAAFDSKLNLPRPLRAKYPLIQNGETVLLLARRLSA